MRALLFCFVVLLASPAIAGAWGRYENPRFGYGVDIPPGFAVVSQSDNGDGRVYRSEDGRSTLTTWGAYNLFEDYAATVSAQIAGDEADGWALSYRAETPDWAAYSGARNGHVLYVKSVAACEGSGNANFRLQYGIKDIKAMDATVARLAKSLTARGECL